jgi:hypothetical protein
VVFKRDHVSRQAFSRFVLAFAAETFSWCTTGIALSASSSSQWAEYSGFVGLGSSPAEFEHESESDRFFKGWKWQGLGGRE